MRSGMRTCSYSAADRLHSADNLRLPRVVLCRNVGWPYYFKDPVLLYGVHAPFLGHVDDYGAIDVWLLGALLREEERPKDSDEDKEPD